MKKPLPLISAVILLSLACYLYYMRNCEYAFHYMAVLQDPFSLKALTMQVIEEDFKSNWFLLGLVILPAIAGLVFWWRKPTIKRYLFPTLYLFFWCNWFLNWAIGGRWAIQGILKDYPAYYHMLPGWFQFIVDYFPAIGFWR